MNKKDEKGKLIKLKKQLTKEELISSEMIESLTERIIERMKVTSALLWEEKIENLFNNSILTIFERKELPSIANIIRLLTDDEYRDTTTRVYIKNESLRRYWSAEFPQVMEDLRDSIWHILNRLNKMIL